MHTIENPLLLTWDGKAYKVDKPNQETQKLVSIEYAQELEKQNALLRHDLRIERMTEEEYEKYQEE